MELLENLGFKNNMMINIKNTLILCLLFVFAINMNGQDKAKTIQPTIMVVPFAKKHQSYRMVYENNESIRIASTKVKEAFDERGVNTIDLIAKLKQTNNTEALTEEQTSSLKDEVLRNSGADIYVVVESNINKMASGNSVNVILTAYDAFSGESLANKTSSSPTMHSDNFDKLTEKAVEKEIDNLLNTIQSKFDLIVEDGKTVTLTVGVSEDATFDLDMETPDGELLSDYIELILEDIAYKGNFHVQGVTNNKIIFDLVKIPLRTESGNNYRVSRFASAVSKKLRELDLEVERTIVGNSVVLTLK